MSQKTVKQRVSGIRLQRGSAASNRHLTPIQEESLKQWILLMDQRGMPPRIATVRQIASILATQKGAVDGAAEAAAERPQRAVRKCSMCKSTEHTARTCPRRQATRVASR